MTRCGRLLRSRTRAGVVVDANNGRTTNVRTEYDLLFKFAENGSFETQSRYTTIEAARAATHLGDPGEAYTDADEWQQVPDGNFVLAQRYLDVMGRSSPWLIEPVEVAETDAERIELAVKVALEFGQIDGEHHKMWVIDQMLRCLTGDRYGQTIVEYRAGVDGPDTYSWDEGIAP